MASSSSSLIPSSSTSNGIEPAEEDKATTNKIPISKVNADNLREQQLPYHHLSKEKKNYFLPNRFKPKSKNTETRQIEADLHFIGNALKRREDAKEITDKGKKVSVVNDNREVAKEVTEKGKKVSVNKHRGVANGFTDKGKKVSQNEHRKDAKGFTEKGKKVLKNIHKEDAKEANDEVQEVPTFLYWEEVKEVIEDFNREMIGKHPESVRKVMKEFEEMKKVHGDAEKLSVLKNEVEKLKKEISDIEEAENLLKLIDADMVFIEKASETMKKLKRPVKEVTKNFNELKQNPGNVADLRNLKKNVEMLKLDIEEAGALTKLIDADLHFITKTSERIEKNRDPVSEVSKKFDELKEVHWNAADLRKLKKIVKAWKQQLSTMDDDNAKETERKNQLKNISTKDALSADTVALEMVPNLFKDSNFERTLQFKDFEARYNELPIELKLCLLCFSIFPEKAEIKRRVMVFWWIGEGFVPPRTNPAHCTNPTEEYSTPEEWANHYFDILLGMGFIEAAHEKTNAKVDSCRMHPFIRSMLNKLAERTKFFEFDDYGNVNEEWSKSLRACLVEGKKLTDDKPLDKIHALFNVNEEILDFKREVLSKMKNVNVLYLGRWQSQKTHHIEIDDTKTSKNKKASVLDGLENMKHLKFLSLQGVSRISELPKSVLKLKNLMILDIRACHNLEKIPNEIECLVNLTHLDMSECYLLDEMPKGISSLTNLQVLNGFVVGEFDTKTTCTLDDLKKFAQLRKLSIHTGLDGFPSDENLITLNQFEKLQKLTIVWGRGSARREGVPVLFKQGSSLEGSSVGSHRHEEKHEQENKKGSNDDVKNHTIAENFDRTMREKKEIIEEGERNKNFQSRGIPTREIRQQEKGKEILKPSSDGASTSRQVNFTQEVEEREARKLEEISESDQKSDFAPIVAQKKSLRTIKEPAPTKKLFNAKSSRALPRLLSIRSTSRVPRPSISQLPSQLTKLDLQCLPGGPHAWLKPGKLKSLEKLYIRGGRLFDLGQFRDFDDDCKDKWTVKELRLKYLDELDMDWRELMELFPELNYLEKVDCPKLSFFPCDETGVWMKKKSV